MGSGFTQKLTGGQHTNTDPSDIDTFEMLYNRLGSPGNTTLSWLVDHEALVAIELPLQNQHEGIHSTSRVAASSVNSAWATPTVVFLENLGVFPIGQLGARGRGTPLCVSE